MRRPGLLPPTEMQSNVLKTFKGLHGSVPWVTAPTCLEPAATQGLGHIQINRLSALIDPGQPIQDPHHEKLVVIAEGC